MAEDLGTYQGIRGMRSGSHIGGCRIFTGSGTPLATVTAVRIGDLYIDYTNGTQYIATATGTGSWLRISPCRGATASVADGGTITHGFGTTPTVVTATGSVEGETVSVAAIGATTFTVAIKTNVGGSGTTQTIYWGAS